MNRQEATNILMQEVDLEIYDKVCEMWKFLSGGFEPGGFWENGHLARHGLRAQGMGSKNSKRATSSARALKKLNGLNGDPPGSELGHGL